MSPEPGAETVPFVSIQGRGIYFKDGRGPGHTGATETNLCSLELSHFGASVLPGIDDFALPAVVEGRPSEINH